ncbi:MAG: glycosyltransferase [Desulfobacterales bacterium]|nr:glycosyltransferase [Desulfobacterales bacterium]
MKILVNAATAIVGGGVQVATSFIADVLKNPHGHEFYFAVSELIAINLKAIVGRVPENMEVINISPARMWKGKISRKRLLRIESDFVPDVVYSIASPSYVKFRRSLEVARFTDPWVTHPNKLATSQLSNYRKLYAKLLAYYKVWALRNVKFFNTQTTTASIGLARRLKLNSDKISVIPNCHNQLFHNTEIFNNRVKSKIVVFVLGFPYPHKNLLIVPQVAEVLLKLAKDFQFIMTMPENSPETSKIFEKAKELNVDRFIKNIGRLTLDECKNEYLKCSVVFLPTLLETFSVTYLEAMAMKRPIVTTDLDFAHDVCKEAAEYFEPLNAVSAANAILKVTNDMDHYQDLVRKGAERLKQFPSPEEKFRAHLTWLEKIVDV